LIIKPYLRDNNITLDTRRKA